MIGGRLSEDVFVIESIIDIDEVFLCGFGVIPTILNIEVGASFCVAMIIGVVIVIVDGGKFIFIEYVYFYGI